MSVPTVNSSEVGFEFDEYDCSWLSQRPIETTHYEMQIEDRENLSNGGNELVYTNLSPSQSGNQTGELCSSNLEYEIEVLDEDVDMFEGYLMCSTQSQQQCSPAVIPSKANIEFGYSYGGDLSQQPIETTNCESQIADIGNLSYVDETEYTIESLSQSGIEIEFIDEANIQKENLASKQKGSEMITPPQPRNVPKGKNGKLRKLQSDEWEFTAGHQSDSKLLYCHTEKQLYRIKHTRKHMKHYYCYSPQCKAKLKLIGDDVFISEVNNHNHPVAEKLMQQFKLQSEIKKKVACNDVKARKSRTVKNIYNDKVSVFQNIYRIGNAALKLNLFFLICVCNILTVR